MRATTSASMAGLPSSSVGRGARRLVGFERHYRCSAGHESHSWTRLRACPGCGESLTVAVIHRVAVA